MRSGVSLGSFVFSTQSAKVCGCPVERRTVPGSVGCGIAVCEDALEFAMSETMAEFLAGCGVDGAWDSMSLGFGAAGWEVEVGLGERRRK
jgi:hypothetical protein